MPGQRSECVDDYDEDEDEDEEEDAYRRIEAVRATREDWSVSLVLRHVPEIVRKNVGVVVFMLLHSAWMIAVSVCGNRAWPTSALLVMVLVWLCMRVYKTAHDQALLRRSLHLPKLPRRFARPL